MLLDLGEISFVVDKLRAGLVVGTDFDVPPGGPGSYLLFAVVAELFPPFLDAYWSVVLFLRVGISALALELGRRILPGAWPLLPLVCLLVAPGPLPSGFFVAGSLLLALACVHYLSSPGWRRALVLGLTVLTVGFFRLDLGVFGLLASAALCLSSRARRPHLSFALMPPLAMLALVLSWAGDRDVLVPAAMDQVWTDLVGGPLVVSPALGGPSLCFLVLPLVVYLLLLVRWRRSGGEDLWCLLLAGLGVLTMKPLGGTPDFAGFLVGAPLLYFAIALVLSAPVRCFEDGRVSKERSHAGTGLAIAVATLLPLALGLYTQGSHKGDLHTGSWTLAEERTVLLETLIGSAWLTPEEHEELAPLLAWLERSAPEGPLWVPTDEPLYYALAGREDVTGYASMDAYVHSEPDQDRLLARLKERPPVVAVVRASDSPGSGVAALGLVAAPRVHAYLMQHYEEARRFGANRTFLRRRPPADHSSNR